MENGKAKKTSSHTKTTPPPSPYGTTLLARLLVVVVGPVVLAVLLFRADRFDPAPIPDHSPWSSRAVPMSNRHILAVSERLGDGLLPGPEDLAYDADEGVIYTGCVDGWIKKVAVAGEEATVTVENWAYVGGRPLGVALGVDKQLIVAESHKGLLRVTREGAVDLLTDEADQVKFRLTDGVDVARNGMIYFTDASYKYNLGEYMLDHLEGRPHGRLMSFDPQTNLTQVLLHDLHFANGLALSPYHDFLVFCETPLRRCRKYHIEGERKGSVEDFIDNLPGYPDNIKYDGEGHFWIALPVGRTFRNMLMHYPIVRKAVVILDRFVKVAHVQKGAGVLSVSLEGQAIALYSDPALAMVTGGIKIGRHLYYGSLVQPFIGRLDLTQHAARAA
eukprot:TRINITY_DN3632_c0_g1_i1.p1 TRINITY_DN3632_c0_g1~~TRINITY_DN3632_c0_g1_i1.p1  ORF type:complete len:411 (-),score=71.43 TRINITY_DN3632_c0_g1_i1:419-1585(-)